MQTQGVPTIRAFGWRQDVADDNCRRLDDSQRPFYLLLCLQRWLNVVLDSLVACIAVGIMWLAVAFQGTTAGAEIGVALNVIIIANATLLSLVKAWTDLEISLGAVARLKDAEKITPQEEELQDEDHGKSQPQLEESWPSAGAVELTNVSAVYE